jgi:hypothetical protein
VYCRQHFVTADAKIRLASNIFIVSYARGVNILWAIKWSPKKLNEQCNHSNFNILADKK